MSDHKLRQLILVGLLVLALGSPIRAAVEARPRPAREVRPAAAALVLAESWGISKFLAGGGRTRIVQICVVVMCLALFIMMRKLI